RYYDPQVGRFLSRDPVLSEHPYLYYEHEPVNRVDPGGHTWGRLIIWIVGSFAGQIGEYFFGLDPEDTWPLEHFAGEAGDDLMNDVGLLGFGFAFGAATTIIGGLDVLAEGMDVVLKYRHRLEDYMNENGQWD
ncbi:MAG: RHS repeat-associated core domain-containing protein, partial [Armatimonadota bacterium]|nr:RHS repeat-associated core domain-containing protein [Armatimonadota bacterium]